MDGIKIIRNQFNDMFSNMDFQSFSTRKHKQEYIVKLTFKNGGHCQGADNYLDYSFRRKKPSEVKRSYLRKEKFLKELESKLNNVYQVEEELLDFEELFGISYANVGGHVDNCEEVVSASAAVFGIDYANVGGNDHDCEVEVAASAANLQGAAKPDLPIIEIVEKFQSVSYNEYHELNFTEQLSVIYEEVTQFDENSLNSYIGPVYLAAESVVTDLDLECVFINSIEMKAILSAGATNNNKYSWAEYNSVQYCFLDTVDMDFYSEIDTILYTTCDLREHEFLEKAKFYKSVHVLSWENRGDALIQQKFRPIHEVCEHSHMNYMKCDLCKNFAWDDYIVVKDDPNIENILVFCKNCLDNNPMAKTIPKTRGVNPESATEHVVNLGLKKIWINDSLLARVELLIPD